MSEAILIETFTGRKNKLMRIVRRFFPYGDDADDALQEAFCRLWTRADRVKTARDAEAMAATTVRNLCVDELRRKSREEGVSLDEADMAVVAGEQDEWQEREQLFHDVEKLMDSVLTPLQKKILHKKEYEGMGISMIAEELGMQQSAVRVNLSRARKQIRECYRKQNGYGKQNE